MLDKEGAISESITAECFRPLIFVTKPVVINLRLRSEQHRSASPVCAILEIEVFATAQWTTDAEHLVKSADTLEEMPAHAHIGTHPEQLEWGIGTEASWASKLEDRDMATAILERGWPYDLPMDHVCHGVTGETSCDRLDPVGSHDTIIVGEYNRIPSRFARSKIPGP